MANFFRDNRSATLPIKFLRATCRAAFAGSIAMAAAAAPAAAGHDVFHIFTPAVEAGHSGFELLSTFQSSPAADYEDPGGAHQEHGHDTPRAGYEAALHFGVTEFWMTKLAFGFSRDEGDSNRADTLASENVFRFRANPSGPIDVGWFAAIAVGLESAGTHAIEFGPIVTVANGPFAFTFNPFFEKTFARNREEGIAFIYGWRAAYALHDKFAVGVEGYGEVENIGHAPPVSDQVHRIGPVLYFGTMHGSVHGGKQAGGLAHGDPTPGIHIVASHVDEHHEWHGSQEHGGMHWHAELGLLLGLTTATPDAALKLNIEVDF